MALGWCVSSGRPDLVFNNRRVLMSAKSSSAAVFSGVALMAFARLWNVEAFVLCMSGGAALMSFIIWIFEDIYGD